MIGIEQSDIQLSVRGHAFWPKKHGRAGVHSSNLGCRYMKLDVFQGKLHVFYPNVELRKGKKEVTSICDNLFLRSTDLFPYVNDLQKGSLLVFTIDAYVFKR
ncbi:hypothetical protein DMA11_12685 [Marinilabiliaceae bacterium JC017]|nr:hypothetical protein DMA11_12685 [Marinilabiliaceae bacterium JC017]